MEGIGAQLRKARQDRGWTLEALSVQSGLSTGFLSQVERDQSTLSIVSLSAICHALEIPMDQLFVSSGPLRGRPARVTKADAQLRIQIGESPLTYRYLTPQLPTDAVEELLIAEFPAGAHQEATVHQGEEFGYVLAGQLSLCVAGERHRLAAGDSYCVASQEPHEYNVGKAGARILMAVTQQFIDSPATGRLPRRTRSTLPRPTASRKGARRAAN